MTHKTDWWTSMIAKYGTEEAVRDFMRVNQAKSRKTYKGTGGLAYMKANDPEKLKEIVDKATEARKRKVRRKL